MAEERPFAFVLMPFGDEFEDVYKIGIKGVAEQEGIIAQRVDEQLYKEGMLERIYNQIAACDFLIADMTGRNPNVFYEVGYAHAKDKLCILITSDASDIPFDLKHRRHIVYGTSIVRLKSELQKELLWAKSEIVNVKEKRIRVTLQKCEGTLEKSKYSREGTIEFRIDLNNDSNAPSPEIENAYFFSTSVWTLEQDRKTCPSSHSDDTDFDKRHFLNVPIRRIRPGGWAQIQFAAKRTFGWSFNGDDLKDSYRVTGRSMLRLVTSEGNADYEFSIDVEVDSFPF